jgi:outer membrane protein
VTWLYKQQIERGETRGFEDGNNSQGPAMKHLEVMIKRTFFLFIVTAAALAFLTKDSRSQEKEIQGSVDLIVNDIPISPIERAEKDGTALRLSLKDITKLALQNNLDIAISDTNEDIYKNRIIQAYGPYDPAVTLTLGARSTTQPNTNLTNASSQGSSNNTKLDTWNFQFTKNLSTGGSVVASLNSNRSDTNQQFALFSPQYNATSSFQLTQPLLRNRRIDQNRGTIRIANLDLKISDSQFRQSINTTIASIQGVYWDLVTAIRNYEIQRESVKLAQITVDQNREKVRIGVLAPIEITVAQADLASRMVDLVTAQQSIKVSENNLRSTVSNDRKSEIWQKMIVPTDSPELKEYKADLESAIDTALKNRPELEQYNLQLQENQINNQVDRNLKKWQIDAVGSFGTVGVAGPQTISPVTGQPLIDSSIVGGAGTSYATLFTKGFKNWFIGFNIQIPLKNRSLEGQLGQLDVQKKQLLMNRKNEEQKISVEIRNAFEDLESNKQKVDTAKVARQLAAIQLDAENKRFRAGTTQNFILLQRQRDLSAAQGAELQALVAYKKSVIALEQSMYTLLESNDFEIVGSAAKDFKLK